MILRDLPEPIRSDLLSGTSSHALIAALVLSAPLMPTLRLVSDTRPFVIGDEEYIAQPFQAAPAEDDDDLSPSLSLVLSNADRRVGEALRRSTEQARAELVWYWMGDFDLSVTPRVPTGTPTRVLQLSRWRVVEVNSADVNAVSIRIQRRDISQEPFPFLRATENVAPGLALI